MRLGSVRPRGDVPRWKRIIGDGLRSQVDLLRDVTCR
jgi:hypothetical protein